MTDEDRKKIIIKYWWDKENESLLSAERELEANSLSFAVNRLYYTLFYAVSAILLEKGFTFKKHSGFRACFHQHIIKKGIFKIEHGKLYDKLFTDRQEVDCLPLIEFNKKEVKNYLKSANYF